MSVTWILVANASEAKIYQSQHLGKDLKLVKEFQHPESREKINDLMSDEFGRHQNIGSGFSVYEEPTNPKMVEMERFAHQLVEELNAGRNTHQYDRLILISPPQFHGLLNKQCKAPIKNLIFQTIDKDYTKCNEKELIKYLDELPRW